MWGEDSGRVDGWLGPKAWHVLQCILGFEDDQDPVLWRSKWDTEIDIVDSHAVLRGVYLRLSTLGFFQNSERIALSSTSLEADNNLKLKGAIKQFNKFCMKLGLLKEMPESSSVITLGLLTRLYNQDKLIESICESPSIFKNKDFKMTLESFAQVELWLLGYDSKVNQPLGVKSVIRRNPRGAKILHTTSTVASKVLRESIKTFWKDNNSLGHAIPKNSDVVCLMLFQRIESFLESGEEEVSDDVEANLEALAESEHNRNNIVRQFNKIANSIWDGAKRLYKWIVRFVKRIATSTSVLIKNLVRYVSAKARKTFLTVVKAVDVMASGLSYLRNGFYAGSKAGEILIFKNSDFDHQVFISNTADNKKVDSIIYNYTLQTVIYSASCKIVSHTFNIFSAILNLAMGAFGWLRVILSLSKLSENIKGIGEQVKLLEEYDINFQHTNSVFKNSFT